MRRAKLISWAIALEKVMANTVPELSRQTAQFVFKIVETCVASMKTEDDKRKFFPKFMPFVKKVKALFEGEDLPQKKISADVINEIIKAVSELCDEEVEYACNKFILLLKNYADDGNYEKMPVLFCPFCKIETATKVFNVIKRAQPTKLYVFSDGWREDKEGEKEKVEQLRQFVLDGIDWDCEVFTKFNEKNEGPRFGLEAAYDWFFENEEMGIILEDDTLPDLSFFRFCSELLMKYKDEEKVFLITGTNEFPKKILSNTYSFRRNSGLTEGATGLWGWASWRRAWNKHDRTLSRLEEYKKKYDEVDEDTLDYDEYLWNARMKYLVDQVQIIKDGKNKTWDIQLEFTVMLNDALIIVPDCNLVTNIGYGVTDAEHGGFHYHIGGFLPFGGFLFPMVNKDCVAALPLTKKEYIRTAFRMIFMQRKAGLFQSELSATQSISVTSNVLTKASFNEELESRIEEIYGAVQIDNLMNLINQSLGLKEYVRAQKYLYLALSRALLRGDKNFCVKCKYHDCISACPTGSVLATQTPEDEFIVGINRKTCEFCWNCMKSCPIVNPR